MELWGYDLSSLCSPVALLLVALLIIIGSSTSGRLYYWWTGHERVDPSKLVVVITGCDSGFGRDMALDLSEKGWVVVALCLTKEGCASLKRETKGTGLQVIQGDVTKWPDVVELLSLVVKLLKNGKRAGLRLWAVINNAGIAPMGHVAWLPAKTIRAAMEVNYFGCANVIQSFIPLLKDSPCSRIVNISSMAGITGGPCFGAYSASKHALQGLTLCLREELKPWRVHVCNVNPCFMATPMLPSSIDQARALFLAADKEVQRQYRSEVVLNDGNKVLAVAESPAKVVRHVCDVLLTARAPHFYNPIGVQAGVLRVLLLLPKAWIELAMSLCAPAFRAVDIKND